MRRSNFNVGLQRPLQPSELTENHQTFISAESKTFKKKKNEKRKIWIRTDSHIRRARVQDQQREELQQGSNLESSGSPSDQA